MKLRIMDKTFVYLTGLAVLIILALLFMILGNIVANGWTRMSWEFLSGNPREGMTQAAFPRHLWHRPSSPLDDHFRRASRRSRGHLFLRVRRSDLHAVSLVALCGG